MMDFWVYWLIALVVVLLLFAALYLVVKLGRTLAKNLWAEDDQTTPRR